MKIAENAIAAEHSIETDAYEYRGKPRMRFVANFPSGHSIVMSPTTSKDAASWTRAEHNRRLASENNVPVWVIEMIRDMEFSCDVLNYEIMKGWHPAAKTAIGKERGKFLRLCRRLKKRHRAAWIDRTNAIDPMLADGSWHLWRGQRPYAYIYLLLLDGKVVYVGQASNLRNRLKDHSKDKEYGSCVFTMVPREDADLAESLLIDKYSPRLNRKSGNCTPAGKQFLDLCSAYLRALRGGPSHFDELVSQLDQGVPLHRLAWPSEYMDWPPNEA